MFSVQTYNNLPFVSAAQQALLDQLNASEITLQQLLSELAPLFSTGEDAGKYAVWLLHHHFSLDEGEKMTGRVVSGDITISTPIIDPSDIIAERWNANSDELEHRFNQSPHPPPPSPSFMNAFTHIVGDYGITALGVCYAPNETDLDKINQGYLFLELTDPYSRMQISILSPGNDPSLQGETFQTSWVPSTDSNGCGYGNCTHVCTNGGGCYSQG